MVSLNPTTGHEQSGGRPVLVVSPAEFNAVTKLLVVLPITNGGDFARRLGFAVPVTGIKTTPGSCRAISRAFSTWPPATPARWTLCQHRSWMKCWRRSPRFSTKQKG
jgi:hypothetical protein